MLWQMGGPTVSCTAVQHCQLGKGGDCPILLCFGEWSHFESCSQFWAPQYQRDLRLLASEGWTQSFLRESHIKNNWGHLASSAEKRRLREDSLVSACSWGAVSVSVLCDNWQDPREQHGAVSRRFMLDIRKRLFPKKLVEYWNRLLREWSWPQAMSLTKLSHMVGVLGLCCAGPGVRLDPCGSLATHDILWFTCLLL